MNNAAGALNFNAVLNLDDWNQNIERIKRDLMGLNQTAQQQTREMDSAFKNLSVGIAGYFSVSAFKNFAMDVINVRGEFQKTEIAFSTMLGSAEKAKALMGQMVDLAAKTPFGLEEVSAGAKQLLAFQVPANEVVDVLTRMGNIAAGLGVPLSRINLVYGQVKAKGKLMGDDLRQFTEAGIPLVAELAKKFNKTTGEITNMVSAGKIGFKDVQDVLFSMTNEGGMFFNLMEKQSASLSGKIANLGDSWDQMLNKIGESNEGILYSGIEGLNYLVENYKSVLDIIEALIVLYGSYKAAVIVTSAAQTYANKTIQSEIALLSISEKMKLGRAMVTQRQAEATAREAAAEVVSTQEKYRALQIEVSTLAAKRQTLRQSGLNALAKLQEAKVQLSLSQLELSSMQAVGSAREIEIAQKRVLTSQNAVIAAQETATIAKNAAVANSVAFRTQKQLLENTARALGTAQGAAATASEVAQTAAKNANAIATTRLTLVTTLRTAATRLATQAQVLLNATMLNNPIVLVIAAVAGLTYAYFKLRDTSTSLSIAEKILNDERERSTKSIDELRSKTQELTAVINSDTSTKLQQIEAYKKLTDIYPAILKNMDIETFKKLESTEAQKKLNTEIDKYSTQNLRDQVSRAKSNIQDITNQINALNEKLKKRDGDSGIYLDRLELAKKNLEAQNIVLTKYNAELDERLDNEKMASMSLSEQKKYWEQQIEAITRQISAQEKSNKKKADALDKVSSINSLVKTTSLEFINWNISPLLSQLNKAQEEIGKINKAQSGTDVSKNKAYWEEQKKLATEANDAMSGNQIGSSAWNENIKKIREANEQLKKYDYSDKELLKAQRERDKERKKLEKGAEKAYLAGSIKRYDQQISLLEEALSRSNGNDVRLRYVDKYGKERNAEEIRSVKSVQDEILKLREQRAEREKLIEVKSFEEQIAETERQWKIKYQIARFYGQKAADEQFPELTGSYYNDISKKFEELSNKRQSGVVLSNSEIDQWQKLKEILSSLTGEKDPLTNFNDSIDRALTKLPSLYDQIDYLQQLRDSQDETGTSKGFYAAADVKLQEKIQEQKAVYQEFSVLHESFEKRKLEIEKKYDAIRKQIQASKNTDAEKARLTAEANKDQAKDISGISLELFQKNDLWTKAFGDLERVGPRALRKLREGLVKYLEANRNLSATDLKTVQDQIDKIDKLVESRNPFEALINAIEKYKKKQKELKDAEDKYGKGSDEYKKRLEELENAFTEIIDITGAAAKALIDVVVSIGDAFGGLSDELKQTLAEVQQLIDGIMNVLKGYFSGNYVQMIAGIVQIIGAMVKLLSGDKGRERQIKSWQRAVEDLKTSYDELSKSIERTAGEASLAMNRALIENLQEQKRLLIQMQEEERSKKKADQDKITSYSSQISQINQQIDSVMDNFKKSVTTTDFKELSQTLADALIEAFGKGEDAASSFEKVVDDVMRNAVANALRIKILEPKIQEMVDKLYSSMGYGNGNANSNNGQIIQYQSELAKLEKQISELESQTYTPSLSKEVLALKEQKQKLLALIGQLQAQAASTPLGGNFDGLTDAEREEIKLKGLTAMQEYTAALEQYKDLFGQSSEAAQGLKGDIKGITEKTAGALEGQINAMRINVAEALKIHRENQMVFKNQLLQLTQIELNTRNLVQIRKDISELNSKVKYGAAGIP